MVLPLLLTSAAVQASPLISVQPTAQASFVGGSVTLQVQAVPASGLTYQWQVMAGGTGTPEVVGGAAYKNVSTANLQITTADAALDGNTYGCVVTDGSGSTTSAFVPLKVFAAPATPAPVVTLGNSTVSANSTADISIGITGLTAGQTVRIERFLDFNGDMRPGAGEPLVQSFTLTDGVKDASHPAIPGDQDASANGAIVTAFALASSPDLGRAQGAHLIRISSPTGAFLPIIKTLVVQGSNPQGIYGKVMDAGSNAIGYSLVAATQNSTVVAVAMAISDGSYELQAPVGTYSVVPLRSGYTASVSAQPTVTLTSGVSSTRNNPILTPATAAIAGRVLDASGSPALPGMQLTATSNTGYISLITSNSDGGYVVPAVPGTWTISASPASLALLGYKQPASPAQATAATGSVTALDIPFTSLFTTTTSFALWKTTAGFSESDLANLAISGESADPDGDSLTNLLEYALGGSPKVADSATVAPVVDSNGSQLRISFRCDDSRQDLIYTVQSSDTLKSNSWTDIARSTGGGPVTPISGLSSVTDSGSGARTVTVSATLPAGGNLFLRVKAAK